MWKTLDRVYETSTTTGTGAYTLDGAVVGFQPFSTAGADNTFPYFAEDGTNWECGIGKYLAAPARLERVTILASSNAGAEVDWDADSINLRSGLVGSLASPRALSKSVAGGADVVLTEDEQRRQVLEFTGAITANISVEVDASEWAWASVKNSTTGDFTLTFKVTGQTGFVLQRGRAGPVVCDGDDVIDVQNAIQRKAADVASAATIDLNVDGDLVDVTGAVGITAITLAEGREVTVRFTGAPTITDGASLVLPGGDDIVCAAGDYAVFRGYSGGVVRCKTFTKANGKAVVETFGGFAAASDQETGTSSSLAVTPSVQHRHQSAAKGWLISVGGATPTDAASYNVDSLTDTGVGKIGVNWATDFSADGNSAVVSTPYTGTARGVRITSVLAGSVAIQCFNTTDATFSDPDNGYQVVAYGDQ